MRTNNLLFQNVGLEVVKTVGIILIVVYSFTTIFRITSPATTTPIPSSVIKTNQGEICARTESYEMEPEFGRAISLVKQRTAAMELQLFGHGGESWIYNCLHVQYGEVGTSEGVFYFDDNVSSPDKLVIHVNPDYKKSDDLLTALLLSHEIQHAGQYALLKQYGTKSSCIRDETMAFHWQYQFYRWLNDEERKSIISRAYYGELSSTAVHTQIQMLEQMAMFSNAAEQTCRSRKLVGDWDCYTDEFVPQVEKWVRSNPYYQEQCKGEL